MKKFLLGIITGALLFGCVTTIAEQYSISPNPFDVVLNGKKVDIEGYGINGRTYFQLRDLGDKIGFNVDFKDNTILINTTNEKSLSKEDYVSYNEPSVHFNGKKIAIKIQNGLRHFSASDLELAVSVSTTTGKDPVLDSYQFQIAAIDKNIWHLHHSCTTSQYNYLIGDVIYIDDEPYVSEEDFNAIIDKFLEICEQENITLKK